MPEPLSYASADTDKETPRPRNQAALIAISLGGIASSLSFLAVAMGGIPGGLFFLAAHALALGALVAGVVALFKPLHRKLAVIGMAMPLVALAILWLFWVGSDPTPRLTALRTTASLTTIAAVNNGLKQFQIDNARLPTTAEGLQALLQPPPGLERTWRGPYVPADSLEDGWHQPLVYRSPGKTNPGGYDLFSSGRDETPDTADDIHSP